MIEFVRMVLHRVSFSLFYARNRLLGRIKRRSLTYPPGFGKGRLPIGYEIASKVPGRVLRYEGTNDQGGENWCLAEKESTSTPN